MLTTTVLAARCTKLVAPAMNTGMYDNPITQRQPGDAARLRLRRSSSRTVGLLACRRRRPRAGCPIPRCCFAGASLQAILCRAGTWPGGAPARHRRARPARRSTRCGIVHQPLERQDGVRAGAAARAARRGRHPGLRTGLAGAAARASAVVPVDTRRRQMFDAVASRASGDGHHHQVPPRWPTTARPKSPDHKIKKGGRAASPSRFERTQDILSHLGHNAGRRGR